MNGRSAAYMCSAGCRCHAVVTLLQWKNPNCWSKICGPSFIPFVHISFSRVINRQKVMLHQRHGFLMIHTKEGTVTFERLIQECSGDLGYSIWLEKDVAGLIGQD